MPLVSGIELHQLLPAEFGLQIHRPFSRFHNPVTSLELACFPASFLTNDQVDVENHQLSSKRHLATRLICLSIRDIVVDVKSLSTSFASNLFYVYVCGSESVFEIWIRIHEVPKYRSTSIRIHNTDFYRNYYQKIVNIVPKLVFGY